ncbi:hypothetical protein [Agrobacterium sp. V1]|uniref:hypothetical protein n=1 Tax=Agrobacterium sp. V1 TaxID=3061957 RepID=UPI0026716B16|nr:hypothetical protein [Agrobacterium sp. V1]MDO3444964.1 hypothetical protein [Agrobacterium sp. V1]
MSGLHHLTDLLGHSITFLSSRTSAGLTHEGRMFVGAHVLAIPTGDFSAGAAYCGEFIEISTEWHQTSLGDDYHQLCVTRVSVPSEAGQRIAVPGQGQYPFKGYPHFHGHYFSRPVTRIEVLERVVTNAEVNGGRVEQVIYDSHIRFIAGTHEAVLTTEHGVILGEIELYAGLVGTITPRASDLVHTRMVMGL